MKDKLLKTSSDVLSHRVSLVSMHSSLTLLKVDRVRREVPVDDRVAVGVEI